jgi:hypothetical protein
MKKILSLALVLSGLLSANAFADMRPKLWSGYTRLTNTKAVDDYFASMMDKRKEYHKSKEDGAKDRRESDSKTKGVDTKSKLDWSGNRKMENALVVGADLLFDVTDNLKIGMRTAFLQPNKEVNKCHEIRNTTVDKKHADYDARDKKYKRSLKNHEENPERFSKPEISAYDLSDSRKDEIDTFSLDTAFVPIMLGVNYDLNISDKFSFNVNLFGGYGIVKYKTLSAYSLSDDRRGISSRYNYSNGKMTLADASLSSADGCYVGEVSLGAQYLFAKGLALGLDVSYRYTPDVEVKEYSPLKLNFSGITARLALSYKI